MDRIQHFLGILVLLTCFSFRAETNTKPREIFAEKGDTLSSIARMYFKGPLRGPNGSYQNLIEANPHIKDPNNLQEGTRIFIPFEGSKPAAQLAPNEEDLQKMAGATAALGKQKLPEKASPEEGTISAPYCSENTWCYQGVFASGLVWINLNEGGKAPSLPLRLGAEASYNEWSLNIFHRRVLVNLGSGSEVAPEWYRISAAKLWEFDGGEYYEKLLFRANLGFEYYRNTNVSSAALVNYVESAISSAIGFDSEFVINPQWSTGGILQLGIISFDSYKVLIQGYVSYEFNEKMRLGAGYWFDYYSVKSNNTKLTETHAALESFLKYKF